MGQDSKIEWTDHTFSPWRGCVEATNKDGVQHPACDNCYARAMSKRNPKTLGVWGEPGLGTRVMAAPAYWKRPIKWNREAEQAGERRRVFCASISDVFEDWRGPIVDPKGNRVCFYEPNHGYLPTPAYAENPPAGSRFATMDDLRADLFRVIDATPHLDWLLLSKRPENIRRMWAYVPHTVLQDEQHQFSGFRRNVWIGTSIADQATADVWIPRLLECRDLAPVLFLSAEPLLGAIDLSRFKTPCRNAPCTGTTPRGKNTIVWAECGRCGGAGTEILIDWVIVGGESGHGARPMHAGWACGLRDQCEVSGTAFFMKQLSQANSPNNFKDFNAFPPGLQIRQFPKTKGSE